jgi:hypothetical protein
LMISKCDDLIIKKMLFCLGGSSTALSNKHIVKLTN